MTAPDRYRKKPVVIDAIQWTGKNLRAVIGFTDGPPNTRTAHAGMMWDQYEDFVRREGLKIYTLEGTMNADVGDYIIKGVKGEFYPCKPDIFAATYEPADVVHIDPDAQVALDRYVKEAVKSDPRVKALVGLLREAHGDLKAYVAADWPEDQRAQYPSYQRKWERDMELCDRIDAALRAIGGVNDG